MQSVIYHGRHATVKVPSFGVVAKRDVPVDVTDEAAAALLAKKDWKAAPAAKPAADEAATKENK